MVNYLKKQKCTAGGETRSPESRRISQLNNLYFICQILHNFDNWRFCCHWM